jgi:hypothetical protein
MDRKYQIFLSSTYQDLRDEREQVLKAILEMGHIPVGMEMFSASDEEQWAIIKRQIDQSDYYVVLLAHRYGSTGEKGASYTEMEYDYAVETGIPVLGFVIEDTAAWPMDRREEDTKKQKRLSAFKLKVKKRLVNFWQNKDELHGKVSIALVKATTAYPRPGWVQATAVNGPEVMRELTRLSSENANLRNELDKILKLRDEQHDEVRIVIKVLSVNTRKIRVRKTATWETGQDCSQTLADLFHYAAPNLISENTPLGVAQNLALKLVGKGYYKEWPIGKNIVSDIIADFAALDLLEPSRKKHSVSDSNDYWSLTKLGKQVLKQFRRVRLEEGIESVIEPNDDSAG